MGTHRIIWFLVGLFFVHSGSWLDVGLAIRTQSPPNELCGSGLPLRHICSCPGGCEKSRRSLGPPHAESIIPHAGKGCLMTTEIKERSKARLLGLRFF